MPPPLQSQNGGNAAYGETGTEEGRYANSHTKPRLIVLREFGGSEDMKTAIERALEALIIEKYDERLFQKAS